MGQDKASRADPKRIGREAASTLVELYQSPRGRILGHHSNGMFASAWRLKMRNSPYHMQAHLHIKKQCRVTWMGYKFADFWTHERGIKHQVSHMFVCKSCPSQELLYQRIWARIGNREVQDDCQMHQVQQSKFGTANVICLRNECDQRATGRCTLGIASASAVLETMLESPGVHQLRLERGGFQVNLDSLTQTSPEKCYRGATEF